MEICPHRLLYIVYNCLICDNVHKLPFRSSLSSWSVGRQEAAVQDVDYISFLFSTMTGFSSDKLTSLQELGDDYVLSPSSLTPLRLYCTHLDQFTHHWDVVEVRLLLSHNYFKPYRLSYGCCFHSEMLTMNLDEPESKRLKKRHCFENWKLLIFWTQQWSFCLTPVSVCCWCSAQRAKALSLHSGREGGPLSHCTGWRCVVIGHNGYAQMLMRAHGMMGV